MKGKFIVFEGVDGSGQSTQAKLLADYLISKKIKVWLTKEPTTDSEAGRKIRAILKGDIPAPEDSIKMQELYVEDRRWHVDKIKTLLEAGEWVISDRYLFSTIAYGIGMGADYQQLIKMNSEFPVPDKVFYLDIDAKTAMERIDKRGLGREYFEREDRLTHIRQIYLRLMNDYSNIELIDGTKSIEEISQIIQQKLSI